MPQVLPHPKNATNRIFSYEARAEAVAGDNPVIRYVGTDLSEDRYGSVIEPKGINYDAYMQSGAGVFLWAHQYDFPSIGKTIAIERKGGKLIFDVEFAVKQWPEVVTPLYNLIKDGFMSGCSIGFIPKEYEQYESETVTGYFAENRKYTSVELLELSSVPVPANRNALKMGLEKGTISENWIRSMGLDAIARGESIWLPGIRLPKPGDSVAVPAAPAATEPKPAEPKPAEPEAKAAPAPVVAVVADEKRANEDKTTVRVALNTAELLETIKQANAEVGKLREMAEWLQRDVGVEHNELRTAAVKLMGMYLTIEKPDAKDDAIVAGAFKAAAAVLKNAMITLREEETTEENIPGQEDIAAGAKGIVEHRKGSEISKKNADALYKAYTDAVRCHETMREVSDTLTAFVSEKTKAKPDAGGDANTPSPKDAPRGIRAGAEISKKNLAKLKGIADDMEKCHGMWGTCHESLDGFLKEKKGAKDDGEAEGGDGNPAVSKGVENNPCAGIEDLRKQVRMVFGLDGDADATIQTLGGISEAEGGDGSPEAAEKTEGSSVLERIMRNITKTLKN